MKAPTAEETEEGLKSLGDMKVKEMKKHEMESGGGGNEGCGSGDDDGVIATIGFGNADATAGAGSCEVAVNAVNTSGSISLPVH